MPNSVMISLRGGRQHNLKNINLDIPHNKLVVVTGLSGSGKSTLAFDTLYAEGQRRYVETFSPYTRQFLERMDKPEVDSLDGLPPAIAIEQSNSVKTSRSTVGTMTEIADYLKLLFVRYGRVTCPCCGRPVHPRGASDIADQVIRTYTGEDFLIGFTVPMPGRPSLRSALATLQQQGFLRVWLDGKVVRTDGTFSEKEQAPAELRVIQDRIVVNEANRARLAEGIDSAMRHGGHQVQLFSAKTGPGGKGEKGELRFANKWVCPYDGTVFREPTPALFTFNNPIGACPKCRGFGRTIEIDFSRALPDRRLTIAGGVVKPWQTGTGRECQDDLERHCNAEGVPLDVPFCDLTEDQQHFVIYGGTRSEGETAHTAYEDGSWYGVKGYFDWLESKSYKMHVRVLLSRYRAYAQCTTCHGGRFQPETLNYRLVCRAVESSKKIQELTLPQINQLPLSDAIEFFKYLELPKDDGAGEMLRQAVVQRIGYLLEVGLGYLTLDRSTRTLSGGEVQRVNLTSCLGNSLINTLFVLDEPSIGLHPRDTGQLIRVMKQLRDRGNTVIVVEHDEAVMRAADHLIEMGPGRGASGGAVVFQGDFLQMEQATDSLTGDYLTGRRNIEVPKKRRAIDPEFCVKIKGARSHNLRGLDVTVPLGVLVAVTGVSGSGKSTLVHQVLHPALLARTTSEEGSQEQIVQDCSGREFVKSVTNLDQSPLSRTPRSNPAVYLGIWECVRELFAETEDSMVRGYGAGDYSFNGGNGRCGRCMGTGSEKIEMQFLADVFVRCPICEGKRFTDDLLKVTYHGKNAHDILEMTVEEGLIFFGNPAAEERPKALAQRLKILDGLKLLEEVGLGYLRFGQPLNQLSGGEAQRLKILRHLAGSSWQGVRADEASESEDDSDEELGEYSTEIERAERPAKTTKLFILDEPTTGLHFEDIRLLLMMLQRLVDMGHSIILIEHNMDVVKCADWVLELGPEAGEGGGQLVAYGTPEQIAQVKESHTGRFLKERLVTNDKSADKRGKYSRPAGKNAQTEKVMLLAESQPYVETAAPRSIQIRGARHHNLKDISVDIPLGQTTVITGLSGSGKSTLAFDLLFAEGQRRYLDSLNAYARQFVEQMEKPDVDSITGIPPSVAIEQRVTRGGRKSTVSTITEIHQFVRLLFAKLGQTRDPETGEVAVRQTQEDILKKIEQDVVKHESKGYTPYIFANLINGRKGNHKAVAKWAERKGYGHLLIDGKLIETKEFKPLDRYREHTVSVLMGGYRTSDPLLHRKSLIERALALGKGTFFALTGKKETLDTKTVYSTQLACPNSGKSYNELEPRFFSYNSPHGWCPTCMGFGTVLEVELRGETEGERERELEQAQERAGEAEATAENDDRAASPARDAYGRPKICPACAGERLNPEARAVRLPILPGLKKGLPGRTIGEVGRLTVNEAREIFSHIKLKGSEERIARDVLPEVQRRLDFLCEVGLGYLTLDRGVPQLSGGESQRIRLAAQLGSQLQGVLYVLDEPTIGLHPRDNARLLKTLGQLRSSGNTLVIVEHDEETMSFADHIIDLGPGAGRNGGNVVATGTWDELTRNDSSVTGQLLAAPMKHPLRGNRRTISRSGEWAEITGARMHNIKGLNVRFPVGKLVALCGVSGAGKSTLLHEIIKPAAKLAAAKRHGLRGEYPWSSVKGFEVFTSVYEVDQTPIGKTSRSTPATYIGLMDEIRDLFALVPLARQRGYTAGHFSFNSGNGRCDACGGAGILKVEMNFLPTADVTCESCGGKRYNPETLEVEFGGKSISDVLLATISEAREIFSQLPRLNRVLSLLEDTGLGYLTLGQRGPTLSGGEAQRLKLVAELSKSLEMNSQKSLKTAGFGKLHNLYLLEEPTIGLHLSDVQRLIQVMHRLVDSGHTVIVIEHHADVLAEADYLIELGPEAGDAGGKVIAKGTPEQVAEEVKSVTGPYLKKVLRGSSV